jgi:hypothetical protein
VSVKTCPNCGQATRDDDRFCPSCGQPTDPLRPGAIRAEERARRTLASSASTNVAGYARALRRFWWVLVIGVALAILAGLLARFSISLVPPGLEEKDRVSWTSESRLLITSADNPHFRSKETLVPPETEESATDEAATDEGSTDGGTTDEATTGGSTDEGAAGAGVSPGTTTFSSAPDLNTIVRNANTYLYVIESDEVAAYRRREFGELPGTVQALGVTSVVTANRVELSEIPIIRLIAVADTPEDAVNLADKTGKAFIGWLEQFQVDHDILRSDRMVVQQLNQPKGAVASAGPSTALPILVFIVIFGAFCALAVLLDRLMPAGQPRPARTEAELPPQPVEVKKTA